METAPRDPHLWRQAKARAKFTSHLLTYLFINALLWAIWFLTGRQSDPFPWPLWVSFFWGIGLVSRGLCTYGGLGRDQLAEREYQRLLKR